MSTDSYLLANQPSELERLQLQSKVWEPSGRRLLDEIGDGQGLRVLDIGCGALGWLRLLSEWVGPEGEVVGTDVDEKLLGDALKSLEAVGMPNVELVVDDLFDSRLEPHSFDLVHARFMIAPLARGPEVVAVLKTLVKPGGRVVLEEWDFGSWHFNPPAPAAERLIGLIYEIFSHLGGEAGRELPALLREAGIADPQIDAHAVALNPGNPYLRLPLQFSVSLEPRLLKLVTSEELEALRRDAEAELAEPHRWGTTFTLIQCWGQQGVTESGTHVPDTADLLRQPSAMPVTGMPAAAPVEVDRQAIDEFAETIRGELVHPADRNYDERRKVWNGSIDRYPALIARCAGVADVIAAVRFAGRHRLQVAVRSGGHSFPGHSVCDGGMVIDLSSMKGVRVDPVARTVRAQAGVLLGELDRETQAFGLAVPAGVVTHTGLAGLTLGGGLGWLVRHYGLTIDQLLSVDVVTAEGELVKASPAENADLFWGVRGGGGNFGIVTEFEFRAHLVGPQVVAGGVFWPVEETPRVLRFYRDWIADAPDELMTAVGQRRARQLPFVPPDLVGKRMVGVAACYSGSVEDGERILRPLKEFGSPVLDLCMPKPFLLHQASFDPFLRPGWWYYVRSCDVAGLADGVIDVIAEYGQTVGSDVSALTAWHMGGAVERVGEAETAFNGRGAGFTFNIAGGTESRRGFEEEREWARGYWSALAPYHSGVYVNFLMEEGEERIRQAYGEAKYERLKALKRKYDPENFFRLNQNISPL